MLSVKETNWRAFSAVFEAVIFVSNPQKREWGECHLAGVLGRRLTNSIARLAQSDRASDSYYLGNCHLKAASSTLAVGY